MNDNITDEELKNLLEELKNEILEKIDKNPLFRVRSIKPYMVNLRKRVENINEFLYAPESEKDKLIKLIGDLRALKLI